MRMRSFVTGTIASVALVMVAEGVMQSAQSPSTPPLIPIEHFFDNPEIAGAQISPDGNWLSYLKPYKGKLNVYIRRIGTKDERLMTADIARPVTGYFWSVDSKHLLYVQDKGGNENFHVYAVPVSGQSKAADQAPDARDLTPFEGARAQIMAVPREMPNKILVGLNKRNPSMFDAYWLELETGSLAMVAENPGRQGGYLLDQQNKVRVAFAQTTDGGTEIQVRATEQDGWKTIATYPATENVGPMRVHPDNRRLYMTSDHGETDLAQLVLLDLETGKDVPVEKDPKGEADISGVVFSEINDEVLATIFLADKPRIYAKTPQMEKDLANIRKLHGGSPSVSSRTFDEMKWIVAFNSPTDPGPTYLYDRATGKAEFLFRPRPWLKPEQLAEMTPISFKARDGLTVHGYLTTPRGATTKNLPLVLLVHGGPWARDAWGYSPEVQLLANRGYAVLQINYRGSTGYGKKFLNAAVKQWAQAMHYDLLDGVKWAVEKGVADPKKVGIYGGSYGGYATLVGLTFTPEVFACGVDYVGPSSLITLIESFPAYWRPFLAGSFYRHVGDPSKEADREDLKKRSPLFFVDKIEDPLLIVQGANDPRVTKREADQMVVALRDRKVPVRYLLAENEGHGFLNPDNRMALYRSMEVFFKDCLNGRAQPQASPAIESQIAKMSVDVATVKVEEAKAAPAAELRVGEPLPATKTITEGSHTKKLVLLQGGQEREIGTVTEQIRMTEFNGKPAIERVQTIQSAMIGAAEETLTMDRSTLGALALKSANARRKLSLDFSASKVTGTMTATGGEAQTIDTKLDGAVFDMNALDLVVRSLPLAEGYGVKVPVFTQDFGGKLTAAIRVSGSEQLDVGGTKTDSWVVESDVAGQKIKFWVAKDSRRVLRSSASPAPGVELRMVM